MTYAEIDELFERVHAEIMELNRQGRQEYAHDERNAFANFERIGADLGLSREHVLLVYLLKHLDGIKAYVNGLKSQREDVRGRIRDAIVYLHLLYGMVEEMRDNCAHLWVSNDGSRSTCDVCGEVL